MRLDGEPLMQGIVLGEVGSLALGVLEHRQRQQFAQIEQCMKRRCVASGGLCLNQRILGRHQLGRDLGNIGVGRARLWRRRHLAGPRGPLPFLQHVFDGHVEIDRPARRALRQFAGPDDLLV